MNPRRSLKPRVKPSAHITITQKGTGLMSVPTLPAAPRRRARSLAQDVVDALTAQIENGTLRPGDKLPTETEVMAAQGVSRTVVREAISRMQASGLIETRHGIGSFVLEPSRRRALGIDPATITTLRDVLAVLELRISLESECASLAAQRASDADLAALRRALDAIASGAGGGHDTAQLDFQFHLQIAQSTGNRYFVDIMTQLGASIIPRTRVNSARSRRRRPRALRGPAQSRARGHLRGHRTPRPGGRARRDAHAPHQ
jgi:DNA-binding FadR family transcriptional regulator